MKSRLALSSWVLVQAVVAVAGLTSVACAQTGNAATREPLWEVGGIGFGVSQQAWPGSSETVRQGLALPYVLYRGPWLRIDRSSLGLRAVRTSSFELDIGASGSFGTSGSGTVARSGMPELGTRVEFGPRAKWQLGSTPGGGRWQAELPLRGVFDLSDSLASRGFAIEPEISYRVDDVNGWRLSAGLSALWGDRRLNGSFYDVDAAFATPARPAYQAQAGLIALRLGLTASYRLSPDWRVFGFGRLDSVAGAANEDSPLVSQRNGFTGGLGLLWTWKRSGRTGSD